MPRFPTDAAARRAAARAAAPAAGALAVLLAVLTACSPFGGGDTEDVPMPAVTVEPASRTAEELAFPVTVSHRYGDTDLAEAPMRIVTLGRHDVDTVLSLGLRPVGIRDPFGAGTPYSEFPWAAGDLSPEDLPIVATPEEIDFAAIDALDPDLILAVDSDLDEADYRHLSEIAHTVAQPPDVPDFQASWQEETRLVATAVGLPRHGDEVIAAAEEEIRSARAKHPVFADADVALITYAADGTLRLVNPYEPRARFLAALGMRFPDEVSDKVGDEPFDAPIDTGDLDELGRLDTLVWLADPAAEPKDLLVARDNLETDPAYRDLRVVRKGGSVFLTDSAAVAFASSISLAHAADENARALADALEAKKKSDKDGIERGNLPGQDRGYAPRPAPSKTKPPKDATPTPSAPPVVPTLPPVTHSPTTPPKTSPPATPSLDPSSIPPAH